MAVSSRKGQKVGGSPDRLFLIHLQDRVQEGGTEPLPVTPLLGDGGKEVQEELAQLISAILGGKEGEATTA